jgi:flagellar basal body-associated protein FliL
MKKILIIAVIVLALGAGAFFLFFNKPPEGEPEVVLYNYAIEDSFIANVSGSQKLVKATIILAVNKKGMDTELTDNIYIIRDTILMILRSLTDEDISSADIMNRLRDEIPAALNKALNIDNIVSVYFSDFVMQ